MKNFSVDLMKGSGNIIWTWLFLLNIIEEIERKRTYQEGL